MNTTKLNYDILAVDVDGTLLDKGGNLSTDNHEALRHAADAGLEIVLCTGRSLVEASAIVDQVGLTGTGIFVGGAVTVDLRTRKTLRRRRMAPEIVFPLARLLNEMTDHHVLLLKDRSVVGVDYRLVGSGETDLASQWWFAHMPVAFDMIDNPEDDPHPDETVRISIVTSAGKMRLLSQAVHQQFGSRIFTHDFPVTTASDNGRHLADNAIHLMEIFHHDTNKWTALQAHAQSRSIPVSRIAAIGDEVNDLHMIKNAGLGIAMGNAVSDLKNIADQQTNTNEESGVATAINHILTGEW